MKNGTSAIKGMTMMTGLLIIACILSGAGCKSRKGQDSLSLRQTHRQVYLSECTMCHSSTNSPALDPLVTGGSGTAGKHGKHVAERRIACERCHDGYLSQSTHMNGTMDSGNAIVSMVSFSIVGSRALWTDDTGTKSGRCASVTCHGNETLDWYGTAPWTTPAACVICHTSIVASEMDPFSTNGVPPAGRHVKHVTSRGIVCDRCHHDYPAKLTHMNGRFDTAYPAVTTINFNITGPTGTWNKDANVTQSGSCSAVACHGPDTVQWYGTSIWSLPTSCTTCHVSGSALDPVATNGSGGSGKHMKHVASFNFSCSTCHLNYTAKMSHASGVMDTQAPTARLVSFDATNPTGTWIADIGQETGACASLFCHGTESPAWYGTAGVSPVPCGLCHAAQRGVRRPVLGASGDFGANVNVVSNHVVRGPGSDPKTDQCLVCHDLSNHTGGTVFLKNADTGAGIAYNPSSPSSLEPFCLSCHDADGAIVSIASGGSSTTPFADNRTLGALPHVAGDKIASYWNSTYGAHRDNGLTCAGSGAPGTGCHGSNQAINMHGSVSKGLLSRNLTLPVPNNSAYDYDHFKLCFDCHANYPAVTKEVVLGYKLGGNYDVWWAPSPYSSPATTIRSLFRDRYIGNPADYPAYWSGSNQTYNDSTWAFDPYEPLHNFHLSPDDGVMQGIWNYRGNSSENGRATCTTCHNIHGTNNPVRSTYEEFGLTRGTNFSADSYVTLSNPGALTAFPINCAVECHTMVGPTSYWHTPSGE